MSEQYFNIDDFRKWMKTQPDEPELEIDFPKIFVESKTKAKKIAAKMVDEEGDATVLAEEFAEEGGFIVDRSDDYFLIQVNSGKFYIPKQLVRKS